MCGTSNPRAAPATATATATATTKPVFKPVLKPAVKQPAVVKLQSVLTARSGAAGLSPSPKVAAAAPAFKPSAQKFACSKCAFAFDRTAYAVCPVCQTDPKAVPNSAGGAGAAASDFAAFQSQFAAEAAARDAVFRAEQRVAAAMGLGASDSNTEADSKSEEDESEEPDRSVRAVQPRSNASDLMLALPIPFTEIVVCCMLDGYDWKRRTGLDLT